MSPTPSTKNVNKRYRYYLFTEAQTRDLVGLRQIVPGDGNTPPTARLADLQERFRGAEQRTTQIREQIKL